jgi:hypothetical protein
MPNDFADLLSLNAFLKTIEQARIGHQGKTSRTAWLAGGAERGPDGNRVAGL